MSKDTGAKGRKIGRNKKFCERYRASYTRYFNKLKKLERHMRKFPHDEQAQNRFNALTNQGRS